MVKKLAFLVAGAILFGSALAQAGNQSFTKFVDPLIGSGGHGHVFVGANVPFGMVQLGPNNLSKGWDWCSGYHSSDSTIIGFSHTHLSGTGIGDLGDILLMPTVGAPVATKGYFSDLSKGYVSTFKKKNEQVRPGYYSVMLDKWNVRAELTATSRVGFHRYTFPESQSSNIIIDLKEGLGWDAPTETFIRKVDNRTIEGYRYSKGWAKNQKIYFIAKLSKDIAQLNLFEDSTAHGGTELKGVHTKAVVNFPTKAGEQVLVKVGISYVSTANAAMNLAAEAGGWNFDQVAKNADRQWNSELAKVKVVTKNQSDRRIFYTALYHTLFVPSDFVDVNGEYRGADGNVYTANGFTPKTVFSFWDTYRAAHPLYTILQPEKVNDFVANIVDIHKKQGSLPIWHLVGNETSCMVGVHSIPVVVDAYLKGFDGFNAEEAYSAVRSIADRNDKGLSFVRELGYIPADKEEWSVAKALEYAIDDWCVAQMAKRMGKMDDYAYFMKRSKGYAQYFDPSVGFMRGKLADGSRRKDFDPFHSVHMQDDYVEGNAWQYTWLVPHDVEGLVALFGSEKAFTAKLDSLFLVSSKLNEGASSDISGLIGQYAHGNEPSHHILYMYPYVGQQWKTAERVRQTLATLYHDNPDGLSGNEDCGQMSAWYVFSSLGFYPTNPANGAYVFGSPIFEKASISVGKGKIFEVEARGCSSKNIYIQSATLNGKPLSRSFITHKELAAGGKLVLIMGDRPSYKFGADLSARPQSVVY